MSVVSLIGADTPLGRDVKERLETRLPDVTVQLLGGIAAPPADPEEEGEEAVIIPIEPGALRDSDLVICVSDPAVARDARRMAGGESGPPFIDLTYGLEILPETRLRAPLGEASDFSQTTSTSYVLAHPAAGALALILLGIGKAFPIRLAVAQIFEPASERGQAGLSELQQQVTSLLSFRTLEKKVFDAQLSFNMLGRYGEDAPEKLEDVEGRIERHSASLLAARTQMPSLRLMQAPVFHGYTFSVWLELEERPDIEDLEAELESNGIEVRGAELEPPTNVEVAGQSGVMAGLIEHDRNHPRGVWLWAVTDNYRVLADGAAALAGEILEGVSS